MPSRSSPGDQTRQPLEGRRQQPGQLQRRDHKKHKMFHERARAWRTRIKCIQWLWFMALPDARRRGANKRGSRNAEQGAYFVGGPICCGMKEGNAPQLCRQPIVQPRMTNLGMRMLMRCETCRYTLSISELPACFALRKALRNASSNDSLHALLGRLVSHRAGLQWAGKQVPGGGIWP